MADSFHISEIADWDEKSDALVEAFAKEHVRVDLGNGNYRIEDLEGNLIGAGWSASIPKEEFERIFPWMRMGGPQ